MLGTRYLCFVLGGIYRRVWRYATTIDVLVIAAACGLSAVVSWAIVRVVRGAAGLPVSVYVLDAIFCTLLVGGSRLTFRLWVERDERERGRRHRVLIVGAGRSGRSLAREVRETPGKRVVGFIDDNPAIRGRRIAGSRCSGAGRRGADRRSERRDEVVITIAHAPEDRLAAVIAACEEARVPCRLMRRQHRSRLDGAPRSPSE